MRVIPAVTLAIGLAACHQDPGTPLAAAAAAGRIDHLRELLARRADPEERDRHGWAPLHYAARHGQVEAIAALLAAGAFVDRPDTANGWTPLLHAVHKRQDAATRALLAAGADPNGRGRGGPPPLLMAAGYGATTMVRALLERGADPRAEDRGINALWAAAGGGAIADITDGPKLGSCFPAVVDALLERAPDLRLPSGLETRVLSWLAWNDECSELLLRLQRGGERSS